MSVICPSCESTEFTLMDGMHYCNFCGTVIQALGTQREQSEDNQLPATCLSLLDKVNIKTPRIIANSQKEKTIKQLEATKNLGRPWKSDEGFQFIIMEQAKALVQLGASSELPEIVFRIWAQYLNKSNRAFLNEELTAEQLKRKRLFKDKLRDKYPGTISDPTIKRISYFTSNKTQWFTRRNKMAKMDLEINDDDGDDEERNDKDKEDDDDENDYDDDYEEKKRKKSEKFKGRYYGNKKHLEMLEADEKLLIKSINREIEDKKERDALMGNDVIIYDEDGRPIIKRARRGRIKGIERMSLLKTLAITYLGLHVSNPDVLICDVLRWVHEGHVPYKYLTNWPQDMKFSDHEINIYTSERVPTTEELLTEVNRLVYYLDLNCFQSDDIITIATRFVLELGLPSETNNMLSNLIKNTKPNIQLRPMITLTYCVDPAIVAMAYLLFLLKMLFGLDDRSEWLLSDYVSYLSNNIHFDQSLFNWREWMIFCEKKFYQEKIADEIHNMSNILHVSDVSLVLSKYNSLLQNKSKERRGKTTIWKQKRLQSLKKHHNLFGELKKKIHQTVKVDPDDDDDNDDACGLNINILDEDDEDEDHNNDDNNDNNDNNNNIDSKTYFYFPKKNFKKSPFLTSTYSYLVDSKKFRNSIVCEDVKNTSKENLNDSSVDMFEEYPSQLNGDNNNSLKCKSLDPNKTLAQIISEMPDELKIMPKPWKQYMFLPLPKLSHNLVLDKFSFNFTSDDNDEDVDGDGEVEQDSKFKCKQQSAYHLKKPHSYLWLLNLCSKHISTSTSCLESYLKKLENLLLEELKGKQFRRLHMRARFYKLCFSERRKISKRVKVDFSDDIDKEKDDDDDSEDGNDDDNDDDDDDNSEN